jgi:hypothetical protein
MSVFPVLLSDNHTGMTRKQAKAEAANLSEKAREEAAFKGRGMCRRFKQTDAAEKQQQRQPVRFSRSKQRRAAECLRCGL